MMAQRNITDRAKRYRAQNMLTGPKKCVICGSTRNIDVMHLDGNESHGQPENLAYGCRSCNGLLAAAFKRAGKGVPTNQYNPAKKEPPTFQQYVWGVAHHGKGEHDEGGKVIHATPRHLRIEYAQRIAELKRGGAARRADERWNPGLFSKSKHYTRTAAGGWRDADRKAVDDRNAKFLDREAAKEKKAAAVKDKSGSAARYKGYTISRTADGEYFSSLDRESWFPTAAAAKRHVDYVKKYNLARNPASAASAAYKEFHGHPPREVITVKKQIHFHEHLSGAGELRKLVVKGIDHRTHTIKGFKGALLAFNEEKSQLFIEGGDQSLDLEPFGITKPHELETLGKVKGIDYQTDKSHLGDEGGNAVYQHKFRTTNENGQHVVVKIARYPDLIYRVRDEQMEFSGGSYEIRAEGIDK